LFTLWAEGVKCELLCRAIGCNVACHARCFTVDQEKWPSGMGDYNGVTLRKNDDCCRTWVCPEHVVSWCTASCLEGSLILWSGRKQWS
jgi:hypothetical protein